MENFPPALLIGVHSNWSLMVALVFRGLSQEMLGAVPWFPQTSSSFFLFWWLEPQCSCRVQALCPLLSSVGQTGHAVSCSGPVPLTVGDSQNSPLKSLPLQLSPEVLWSGLAAFQWFSCFPALRITAWCCVDKS